MSVRRENPLRNSAKKALDEVSTVRTGLPWWRDHFNQGRLQGHFGFYRVIDRLLETMMNSSQPQCNIFFQPDNLWCPSALVATGKVTISLTSVLGVHDNSGRAVA